MSSSTVARHHKSPTAPLTAPHDAALTASIAGVVGRLDGLAATVAQLTERMANVETRVAAVEVRVSSLSLPEQLASMQTLLKEQFAMLEWLAVGIQRVRHAVGNVVDDLRPDDPVTTPNINDIMRVVAAAGAPAPAAAGPSGAKPGAPAEGAVVNLSGLPPELQALLSSVLR